jgi:hypothetical protein
MEKPFEGYGGEEKEMRRERVAGARTTAMLEDSR